MDAENLELPSTRRLAVRRRGPPRRPPLPPGEHDPGVPVRPLARRRHARARHGRDRRRRGRRRARPHDQPEPLPGRRRRCSASRSTTSRFAQVRTLDCGSKGDFAGQPGWVASPRREDADARGGPRPRAPATRRPPQHRDQDLARPPTTPCPTTSSPPRSSRRSRTPACEDRAMIQSFDWRTIRLAKQLDPRIETVALVWQYAGAGLRRHRRRVLAARPSSATRR